MSEFWKSIPKIYCKFCNVWYQDNKSSKDFHERSFKHKNNLNRHIGEVQKRTAQKEKEENEFKLEMQRIERAAMIAYGKDLANDPSILTKPSTSLNDEKEDKFLKKLNEQKREEENEKLRQEALDMVSTKLKKKHEWFESKTIEGKVYYYNRLTMATKWSEPKSGYITIEEQKQMNVTDVPGDQSKIIKENGKMFKHEQFKSSWQEVSNKEIKIDLQLPQSNKVNKRFENLKDVQTETEKIDFKEKTLDDESLGLKNKKNKNDGFGFKKRKLDNSQSRRVKTND